MEINQILWSPLSKSSYYNILVYLEENWTIKELEKFVNRTEEVLNQIHVNPLLYPFSNEGNIHKCVITKQTSLYYRIKSNSIELLVFWDNRQNPKKLRI
ncbi:type II toxin-antitoxin system RelE/ParE family toxin [Mucilaginibacter sp.]|uniref:type II toxin-antitoxin system RelE/ParE family toxin n=1 Tax=Mucilaginibacter sp. TaxID=1882438 RepID=UPI003B000984